MKRPPRFDLDSFLPYRLTIAAETLSVEFSRTYTKIFGLSVPEWRVLIHLTETGEISVRDIERRVGLEKSKVSRAASRLESAGYISKGVNPDDRRLVKLALTEEGWSLMTQLIPLALDHQRRLAQRLGENLDAFMGMLRQIEDDEG